MSKVASYISIRDDSGPRSLSLNERAFLREGALTLKSSRILRIDGRGPGELRKVKLHLSRSHNKAECTVQLGETRVSAEINASLQPPLSEDRPSEGVVSITVDTSPMASTAFGMMSPLTTTPADVDRPHFSSSADDSQKLLGNKILRCLERTILLGCALDTEALCVQSGAWVWKLSLLVRILDHGGNLVDASLLASMATLRHYRKPQVDLVEDGGMPLLIHSDAQEPSPLPLHHTPLSISFALIHADDVALSTTSRMTVAALVDPIEREELIQTGSISLAMNLHSEVCLLDFGGGCELQQNQLKQCWNLAEKCILDLCQQLEDTLKTADEKAQHERLHRLQKQLQHPELPPLPTNSAPKIPFWYEGGTTEIDFVQCTIDPSQELQEAEKTVQDQKQEAYRLKALEYNRGHVAAKIKENDKSNKIAKEGSTLLAAMLKSVKKSSHPSKKTETSHLTDIESPSVERVKLKVASPVQMKEFDDFAKMKSEKTEDESKSATMKMDIDDEEETPTMLTSEFEVIKERTPKLINNDNFDDLAMAIKKKKKKKRKK